MKKIMLNTILTVVLSVTPTITLAHPGNTAGDGCHYCRTNCDYWGEEWDVRHCHNNINIFDTCDAIAQVTAYNRQQEFSAFSGPVEPTCKHIRDILNKHTTPDYISSPPGCSSSQCSGRIGNNFQYVLGLYSEYNDCVFKFHYLKTLQECISTMQKKTEIVTPLVAPSTVIIETPKHATQPPQPKSTAKTQRQPTISTGTTTKKITPTDKQTAGTDTNITLSKESAPSEINKLTQSTTSSQVSNTKDGPVKKSSFFKTTGSIFKTVFQSIKGLFSR